MSSLLSHRLPSARSIHPAISFFHTTTSVLAGGRKGGKKSTRGAPPPPPFERESAPHEGRNPVAASPRRQFDVNGGGASRKGPLASPSAVASGRDWGMGARIADAEGRVATGGRSRDRDRDRRSGARGEGARSKGVERRGTAGSPSSPFHRSVERASRESFRMARQLDGIKYDNAHQFAGPSSRSSAGSPTISTGPIPSSPRTSDSARHEEPSRSFSEVDRLLEPGAYDAPELADEFFHPPVPVSPVSSSTSITSKGKQRLLTTAAAAAVSTATSFTTQPLLPGLVASLREMLGPDARPTPIQALSLTHLFPSSASQSASTSSWGQYLLASETGSGKSLAYFLPVLQRLKTAEASNRQPQHPDQPQHPRRLHNPRALVLAPTHELARQLAGCAKGLVRAADDVKLRVLCASRANVTNPSSPMSSRFETERVGAGEARDKHPVDIVVGTPMKLLEMVRGRGFDALSRDEIKALEADAVDELAGKGHGKRDTDIMKIRRGRDRVVHFGTWKKSAVPEMGLADVEWVVVDEADVLFDPDFMETTRALLADVSAARGVTLPASSPSSLPSQKPTSSLHSTVSPTPAYPFHLVLTSATIPKALNTYLQKHHPSMLRLASPRLHRLPRALQTEYVGWTGGNKFADVVRRLRRVWAEDAVAPPSTPGGGVELSKVLVFCNRSNKVEEFAAYLAEHGIKSVALTSGSTQRLRGSNGHLDGFLKVSKAKAGTRRAERLEHTKGIATTTAGTSNDVKTNPHVLITTSLLSRGLDFAPSVGHVFIVDEPRNTIDFIHRAGRTGRAGERGKVVIFGKMKGRGSARTKEVRRRVGVLTRA